MSLVGGHPPAPREEPGLQTAVVVEDQTVFREMLVEFLRSTGEVDVVGQLARGAEAVACLDAASPDLLVVDLVLADGSGLDVIDHAQGQPSPPKVLVVTARESPSVIGDVFRRRPLGIVTKSASLHELRTAVQRVCAGHGYYCETTLRLLREAPGESEQLSPREREIVTLVAKGLSSKEIADLLGLSTKTVSNHRLRIGRKLGFQDIAGFTRHAVAQGWVSGDE